MDPVRTEIMNNRFTAIVEEASAILHRTAYTTFVKLVQDYQCALATPEGEIFAYPSQSGVNVFIGLPLQATIARINEEPIEPGDSFITNDPFATDGAVTHLMDVTMIRPIFHGDRLIAYAWAFVHASDIGGGVPGSISPAFTEVFQEGIRIRPMKFYKADVLNRDVRDIILDNSRIPHEMWGDFKAMLSAMKSADRRLNQLCDRYGVDAVEASMGEVIAFAEQKARSVIAGIPDGTYAFADYLEGFEEGQYTHIKTTMHVRGDEIELDFTGTDPQIPAAYNFVIGDRAHPYIAQALLYYILTAEPDAPKNAGLMRPIRMTAPRGTVINAEFPAAGGSRVAASMRAYDTLLGCLDQALPDGLMAAGPGMSGIIVVGALDPATGRYRVNVINPICGGGGGRVGSDGVDAVEVRAGTLKSVPTEVIEVETVMRVRECRILPDSQAAGRYRSGGALCMELENTGTEATMTVRGMNRFHFRPWGIRGGEAGRLGEVVLNPGTPDERSTGKINVLKLRKGDVVRLTTPSGGGFGDPLERDPGLVLSDIRRGAVSRARAEQAYGIMFDRDGGIDAAATASRRAALKEGRPPAAAFSLGPEREAYDRIWPDSVRSLLATRILAQPAAVRQSLIAQVHGRLTREGAPVDPLRLDEVIAEELSRLGRSTGARPSARPSCNGRIRKEGEESC